MPFSAYGVLSILSGESIAVSVSLFISSAGNNLRLSSSTLSSIEMFVSSIPFAAEWGLFFLGCLGSKIKRRSAEEKQTSALKKHGGEYGNLVRKFLVPLSAKEKKIKLQN